MHSGISSPHLRSCPLHTDKEQTNSYLTSTIASPTNGTLDFSLVLSSPRSSANEKVIGRVGIWNADNQEIGFMLNRSYWGKGYMAEALATVLPHIWKQGVRRIVADVDPRNEASLRSLKRFGFQEPGRAERTFETHLGWCDSVYLALEKPKA